VYASCRADGGDKGKCAKIAWGAVKNAGYKALNRTAILKQIEKNLMDLCDLVRGSRVEKGRRALDPGTVRVYDGVEHIKQEDGTWKPTKKTKPEGKPEAPKPDARSPSEAPSPKTDQPQAAGTEQALEKLKGLKQKGSLGPLDEVTDDGKLKFVKKTFEPKPAVKKSRKPKKIGL
jgi:hypothetical protein